MLQDKIETLALSTIYRVEQWNALGGWDTKLIINNREVAINHAIARCGWNRVIKVQNGIGKTIWPSV